MKEGERKERNRRKKREGNEVQTKYTMETA
jgi:hypothetical protein